MITNFITRFLLVIITCLSVALGLLYGCASHPCSCDEAADSGFYTIGDSSATFGTPLSPDVGLIDILVAKFQADGTYDWHTFAGSTDSDSIKDGAIAIDGGPVVVGNSSVQDGSFLMRIDPKQGGNDIFIMKFLPDGSF